MWIIRSFLVVLVLATGALADTHNCEDCERATVAAMIADEDVTTGDIVTVPAGNCTWSSAVTLDKAITLQGAGLTTVITMDAAVSPGLDSTIDSAVIRDFYFKAPGDTNGSIIMIRGDGWRVTGCKFESTVVGDKLYGVYPSGTSADPGPTGLIDDCTFIDAQVVVRGSNQLLDAGGSQNELWNAALGLGGADAVYIENCTFSATATGNLVDANYGGAYVVRHCELSSAGAGSIIEAHSIQSTVNRSTRKWEVYNNILTGSSKVVPIWMRGGTGVIFNNTLAGTYSNEYIYFDNVRSFDDDPVGFLCDGDHCLDGNDDETGWPCRDQIGRGGDTDLWVVDVSDFDPCGENTQTSVPAYIWNNLKTDGETALTVSVVNDCGTHIQKDRDYFEAEHPTYTCYDCPHPLTGYTGTCDPNTAGRDGYNITKGLATMGSGGTATLGAGGTITLTSP